MRQTNLAASGLVIAVMAVVLLVGVTLNANASSNQGTTSILGPAGLGTSFAQPSALTTASIGLMAGTVMFVVGGVGGLWLVVSRGVGYLGRRRAASAVPALRNAAVPTAARASSSLASGQSKKTAEEQKPMTEDVHGAPDYGDRKSIPVIVLKTHSRGHKKVEAATSVHTKAGKGDAPMFPLVMTVKTKATAAKKAIHSAKHASNGHKAPRFSGRSHVGSGGSLSIARRR